jgi:hypothetical protein
MDATQRVAAASLRTQPALSWLNVNGGVRLRSYLRCRVRVVAGPGSADRDHDLRPAA